ALRVKSNLAAACKSSRDRVSVKNLHDPRRDANFQDSRAAFAGEEQVLLSCSHLRGSGAAGPPVADHGREALCWRKLAAARFAEGGIRTVRRDSAGATKGGPVVKKELIRFGGHAGSPRDGLYGLLAALSCTWGP